MCPAPRPSITRAGGWPWWVRAGGAAGSDLRIWDVNSGKECLAIPLPGRQIAEVMQSVAFSPDGARLAVLTAPIGLDVSHSVREVRVWDSGSAKELLQLRGATTGSSGLAYSPDGGRLLEIGGAGASHRLRDAGSGQEILELVSDANAGSTWAIAFNPDGSRVAGGSADGKARIWDVRAGGAKGGRVADRVLDAKTTPISQVAWSADGRRVSTSCYGGKVMTWHVDSREPSFVVKGLEHSASVTATVAVARLRFAAAFEVPDGETVLKVWDEAGKVVFTATDQEAGPPASATTDNTRNVELSRDGMLLAYSGWTSTSADGKRKETGRLRVWEIATGREILRRDGEAGAFPHATFSPDGRQLATAWGVSSTEVEQKSWISVWDLETDKERQHIDVPTLPRLAFSPDGRRLAGGVSTAHGSDAKGELRIWDTATGQVALTHPLTHGYVSKLVYSADGRSLAAAVGAVSEAGVIDVLDADTGRARFSLAGHRNKIWKLAFSPDGQRLASLASFPMRAPEVKLWDLAGGREMLTLDAIGVALVGGNLLRSSGFGFSPDGQRLFYVPSGLHRDAEVKVWDATPLPDDQPTSSP